MAGIFLPAQLFDQLFGSITLRVDLRDISIVKKGGGTIDDTQRIEGLVFQHKTAKSAGGPTKVANAKIALIQFCISPPKTDIESNIVLAGERTPTLFQRCRLPDARNPE